MRRLSLTLLFLASLAVAAHATQKRALFDNTHVETAGNADWEIDTDQPLPVPDQSTVTEATPRTYWLGAISSYGIDLVKRGYFVATLPAAPPPSDSSLGITYKNPLNRYDLSKYDVFIVPEPNTRFSSAESTAIFNFVQDGGGLIAISDHYGSDRNNDGYDSPTIWDLLDAQHLFGAHAGLSPDPNNNITQNSGNTNTSPTDSIINGPTGVCDSVAFHNGTTFTLYPAVNPSVRGEIWMTGTAKGSTTNAMAVSSVYGNGRVFYIGDSSPVDDGSAAPGNSSIYDGWGEASGNDSVLFLNATLWATRRSAVDGTPPSITVNSPNGGEVWATASPHNLTWTASDNVGVTAVDLEYSANNGGSWSSVASGLANSGTYAWTAPATPTSQALVRATAHDAAGNTANDVSNAVFTVADQAPPAVTLNSPNGGEVWAISSAHNLTWTASDNVGVTAVDLEYSANNGGSWSPIASGLSNTGTYAWTTPAVPTTQALVRATAHDAAGNAASDASNAVFTVADQGAPVITLISPNGGEVWAVGSAHSITWTASDDVGVTAVDLDYSSNGGTSWTSIATGLANSGSYPWTTPGMPTAQALVRATAHDAAGHATPDVSDALFSLVDATPPTVSLTSPDGGETWIEGTLHNITWTAADNVAVDSVNVDYSLHGEGGPWEPVAHQLPNSGSVSWPLPAQLTDSACVRITAFDAAGNAAADSSDSLFHVTPDPAGVAPGHAGLRFLLSRPNPNPSRGTLDLEFSLAAAGPARLEITNVHGRRLWTWAAASAAAGTHHVSWNGRTDSGAPVAAGIYYVRLVSGTATRTARVVRLP